jgi:hypothetical protein
VAGEYQVISVEVVGEYQVISVEVVGKYIGNFC